MCLTCTPYAPYAHPSRTLRTPLTCLTCIPYAPYVPYAPFMCYAPYAPSLQDSDWLMSPPHRIRSMELNKLINIKSWFFAHPVTCLMRHMHHTRHTCLRRLYMPYAPYAPYAPSLQDSNWLMSPPHWIRSMELNNLINIKSWIFPHPLTCLTCLTCYTHLTRLMCLTRHMHLRHLMHPYTPYAPSLQDYDWLMSAPHPVRSMELNNLINIKSWFFPHHLFEKSTCSQNRSISWL